MAKNKGKRAAGSGDEGDGRGKRAKNLYTTLSTRSNPRVLVNALVNLSPVQTTAIVDMGFAGGSSREKYGDLPEKLLQVRMFSNYLESKGCPQMASVVRKFTPSRLCMPWRDTTKKVDCGIYAMRHMESYMGGGTKG